MISLGKIKQFFILASYRRRNVTCDYSNLLSAHNVMIISTKNGGVILGRHAQITAGCKLIAKNKIFIGENSIEIGQAVDSCSQSSAVQLPPYHKEAGRNTHQFWCGKSSR